MTAALHYRENEADLGRFKSYLHNGDPLGKPTKNVPRGIYFGSGQWVKAAIHALKWDGLNKVPYDSIVQCLIMAEKFNGPGYRRYGLYSPYVWAGTNHSNERGKFYADGKFSRNAREAQLGIAAIFKMLIEMGETLE